MALPISMSVHEIQCGSLVHFAWQIRVNKKSGHHSIFDLGGFETGPLRASSFENHLEHDLLRASSFEYPFVKLIV